MRCLIYAKSNDLLWLNEYFPKQDPYMLKIVNKPLLEYSLDLVSLLKVTELRIVSDKSIKGIEEYFKDGAKWGVNISYALTKPEDSLEDVYLKNYSFCKDQDMLFWDGFFFVQYDRKELGKGVSLEQKFCLGNSDRRFIYLPKGEKIKSLLPSDEDPNAQLVIREIHGVVDYYQLSMEILKNRNQSYVLPGYSNEANTFLGINIIYPNSSEIKPPIMIGNGCRFQKYTIIGSNSIIGNNVIVDENSAVTDSIIYDNTYIGTELDIHEKIVYGKNLISGISGEIIHISDKILVSELEQGIVISIFNRLTQILFTFLLIILQLLPWVLLYLPFSLIAGKLRSEHLLNKSYQLDFAADQRKLSSTLFGRFMMKFCLDKFGLLWKVVFGKLHLVGNHLYLNSIQNRKLVHELPIYAPGVFSLPETVDIETQEVSVFYELEYMNKISTKNNLKIIAKTILRRLRSTPKITTQ